MTLKKGGESTNANPPLFICRFGKRLIKTQNKNETKTFKTQTPIP